MAAARTTSFPSTLTLLFFLLLLSTTSCSSMATKSSRNLQSASNQKQQTRNTQKNQIPNCGEIVDNSRCKSNPKCRWCRSDVLDSMCTTKPEAWRLPSQIFTCD